MDTQNQQLKAMLTDMLLWFHNFCEEHELRYFMLGGTMLGAMRHQGFIPWDDDIDIGMPRRDYQQLENLMKTHDQKRYVLETPNSDKKEYTYFFSKLYDTHTTLVENTRYQVKRGIYLDIFPLDGMGNTREAAERMILPLQRKKDILLAMTTGIRKGRSWKKNMAVLVGRCIPRVLFDPKRLLRSLDSECQQFDFYTSNFVGVVLGLYKTREIIPFSAFGTPKLYVFEGHHFWGVADADAYLTCLYGDWRKLPPLEKQVTHHDYVFCDLNHSYLSDSEE